MTPPPKHLLEEVMSAKAKSQNADYAVYIGPEGDFTPEELSALLEIARPVSFGSQICVPKPPRFLLSASSAPPYRVPDFPAVDPLESSGQKG